MIPRNCFPVVSLLILVAAAGRSLGDEPDAKAAAAARDYGAELPKRPLLEPTEAEQAFVVRPGFRVALAASEPLIRSPVAIDFDEDSRLYVAEFPEYNDYADPRPHGTGCVRRLEDRDGDGVYETATLFAENLPRACAVACWKGGVYIGSPPDLIYARDTDGDGKADIRRVVLSGFGKDRAGEGMLNSFRWGLDNRFRIATGGDGGDIARAVEPGARTMSVRGHHLLLDPRSEQFTLTGGGGQHGMSLDDWGRPYVCANSDPFHLVMYDSRYLERNPYLRALAAAVNVAPAGKYTKLYRASAVEPWRALRTRLRSQGVVPGSDEGGSPSGFFTGATGVTVYRGDAYPAEFAGNLFVGDVANNIIHRARAVPKGVLVEANGAEPQGREFLASRDNAFRPVQMANGPDGCLWVVDMYRGLIEGAAFLPPQILKHVDLNSGVDRGRIWRVLPEGPVRNLPRLGGSTTAELVALLEHPSGWHRDTAARLLYERQDLSAVAPLRQLAAHSKSPLCRVHALGALEGLGALEASDVRTALADQEPQVRVHAIRLAERFASDDAGVREALFATTADPEPLVRYQLAFSLGAISGSRPAAALADLAQRDAADPWIRMAILSAIGGCAGEVFTRLAPSERFRTSPTGRTLLASIAAETDLATRPAELGQVLAMLEGPLAGDRSLEREVVIGLLARMPAAEQRKRTMPGSGRLADVVAVMLAEARTTALDETKPPRARAAAVRLLRYAPWDDVRATFADRLAPREPVEVQAAAIETLEWFDDPGVGLTLVNSWGGLSPRLRASAAEVLFARPAWIGTFLDAVENGRIGRGDVDPARLAMLKAYPAAGVAQRATRLFEHGLARRQEVVAAYQDALTRPGDRERGKVVFKDQCSTCHRLEGVGQAVGADLSAIRDRGLDSVLLNILDPNREVKPQYQTYVLVTTSGRILTGMIVAETANGLTIRQADGTEQAVLRLEIEDLRSTGLSYMPEGLEKQVDVGAMADLLAYLNSLK